MQFAQGGLEFPSFAAQFEAHAPTARTASRGGGPTSRQQASEPTILHRIAISTPTLDAAVAFYTDVLDARVDATTASSVDVVWDDGGRASGVEPDRRGITPTPDRAARELVLAGTRFVINP